MFLFDLHCDTLTKANDKGRGLMNDEFAVSIGRLPGASWCQCFAIFIPDDMRGESATRYFDMNARFFRAQMNLHASQVVSVRKAADIDGAIAAGKMAAILTVENASALAGDLTNVKKMASAGVKIMTLTWNFANELGGGSQTDDGISFFGRMAVSVLEQNGIIIDVSHLSDRAFWDLARFAKRPFIASHSNSRFVHNHERNLSDGQFSHIVKQGGLVGINFFPRFINGKDEASFEELASHIEHFLELGGADVIALGSDFDGAGMPSWLSGVQYITVLYDKMCTAFGTEQTDKIFGGNAITFMKRYEALGLLLDALR